MSGIQAIIVAKDDHAWIKFKAQYGWLNTDHSWDDRYGSTRAFFGWSDEMYKNLGHPIANSIF